MKTRRLSICLILLVFLLSSCAPKMTAPTANATTTSTTTAVGPILLDRSSEKESGQNTQLQPSESISAGSGSPAQPLGALPVDNGSAAQPQLPQAYATQAPAQPLAEMPKDLSASPSGSTLPYGFYPTPMAFPPVDNYYQNYGVNPFVDTREDHLSTFGLDVDTASYTVMRRYINDGSLPPADSVRVEEYVNYFDMGYPAPPEVAFALYADGAASPYASDGTVLLRFGVRGYDVSEQQRKPANLVFVIDVSGSMAREYRLELVKRSLQMLVDRLRSDDTVGIVVYGSDARVVLEPVSGAQRGMILQAINSLQPEGSTNAEAGLILGYDMAMRAYRSGSNNRVILCSDGVANTGATDPNVILNRIQGYVSEGVNLTTVGFGMGNFNDVLLEQMADKGNGFYAYVDDEDEARNLFIDKITSTLQTIARDAKVQVDFNPDVVARYRLIGYENRAVADQDFRNDRVDAGEIGAGASVTALYAVQLYPAAQGRIGTVQLRWKDPDHYQVQEINGNFNTWDLASSFDQTDPHYQLAVTAAQFAEELRSSPYAGGVSLYQLRDQVFRIARLLEEDPDVYEFSGLVDRAIQFMPPYYE